MRSLDFNKTVTFKNNTRLSEKKNYQKKSLSKSGLNIISKYPKKNKKVAFCTPIGVGR